MTGVPPRDGGDAFHGVPNLKGDLLVIRADFSIKRSDFGIMSGEMEVKVSETVELTLSIAGASPR